jgi:hypothetical protein
MTLKKFTVHVEDSISEVGVWYCENCASFHIKAGEILLTFTKAEFSAFSNTVFNCFSDALTLEDVCRGVGSGHEEVIEIDPLALAH